jgi:hypothetical protein
MAMRRRIAFLRPEVRPGTLTGAQARGAVAIGRLSVNRLEVEELEIGRLTVREGLPE